MIIKTDKNKHTKRYFSPDTKKQVNKKYIKRMHDFESDSESWKNLKIPEPLSITAATTAVAATITTNAINL